jgi:hypothetical protein
MNKLFTAIAASLALIASSACALANTVTYDLVGATLSDGGTVTGSFSIDWPTGNISSLSISAQPGSLGIPLPYPFGLSNVIYYSGDGSILFDPINHPDTAAFALVASINEVLYFAFTYTSPDALVLATPFAPDNSYFSAHYYFFSGYNYLTAGAVSSTPLPSALPLFATGLAGLGWLARRRRKQAAA